MQVQDRIREIINSLEVLDVTIDSIQDNDDLELHGMNSLRWVKLLVALEKEFGIKFDDVFLMKDENNTILELVQYVEAMIR
jgi:acyl carrier protein